MSKADLLKKLDGFSALEDGWDSYGALPIASTAIAVARQLIEDSAGREPTGVAPTPAGAVMIEWSSGPGYFDIEIDEHGRVAVFAEESPAEETP